MTYRRTLTILVAGILLGGGTVFVVRHRVLAELRSVVARVPVQPVGGSGPELTGPTVAAQAVPTSILRLRAENQALHREVENTTERIRNLTQTPPFDPADSPAGAAHAALMEELRQITSGPDFAEARALGQSLTDYILKNDGRIPPTLDAIRSSARTGNSSSSTNPPGARNPSAASGAVRTYELLSSGAPSTGQRSRAFVARSEEIPLASGKLARLFIRVDGSVEVGVVEDSSDWDDWLAEDEARNRVVPPRPGN